MEEAFTPTLHMFNNLLKVYSQELKGLGKCIPNVYIVALVIYSITGVLISSAVKAVMKANTSTHFLELTRADMALLVLNSPITTAYRREPIQEDSHTDSLVQEKTESQLDTLDNEKQSNEKQSDSQFFENFVGKELTLDDLAILTGGFSEELLSAQAQAALTKQDLTVKDILLLAESRVRGSP